MTCEHRVTSLLSSDASESLRSTLSLRRLRSVRSIDRPLTSLSSKATHHAHPSPTHHHMFPFKRLGCAWCEWGEWWKEVCEVTHIGAVRQAPRLKGCRSRPPRPTPYNIDIITHTLSQALTQSTTSLLNDPRPHAITPNEKRLTKG